jgi:hypothetical protein
LRIEYSDLALAMMRERNIQPSEVEYCLRNPQTVYPNSTGSKIIYKCTYEGRIIKVKIVAHKSPILVATVADSE